MKNQLNDEEIDFNNLKNRIEKNREIEIKQLQSSKKKLIIILEHANLELTKDKRNPEIITSDTHKSLIQKLQKSYEDYRPDILHHCLLSIFESPLNKSNLLQVYIRTKENILIELNPKLKIPKTIKRFCALMGQLLIKYRIRALNSSELLLKVIKNPIINHLPLGCPIISTNEKSRIVKLDEFVKSLSKGGSIAFVVGAMSKGDLNIDYSNDSISISQYPLSAGIVCSKICTAFEKAWDII